VFGNGGLNIGSTRVCTINMARLGMESSGPVEFRSLLRRAVQDCKDLLIAHRGIVEGLASTGYLKFFKPLNWISMDMLFSTIGVVGLYEALASFGNDYMLPSEKGINKAKEILGYIDSQAAKFSEKTGVPFNVEQIPAEGAAVTLAKIDRVFHKHDYELYSNQSIPLWVDVDLVTRARVDGELNGCYSGGGICHLNIGSAVTSSQMKRLILFAIECGLDHFALNPVFSLCENGHVSIGDLSKCPVCGAKIEAKETRVVGYFTIVGDWVKARREWEFPRRVWNQIPDWMNDDKVVEKTGVECVSAE
jgi:anaerobic ribonucleoside-triphosphate reductase